MTKSAQRSEPADSSDRLVVLTEGVVAIAMTLLVLPLVDLVSEAKHIDSSVGELLINDLPEFGGFF